MRETRDESMDLSNSVALPTQRPLTGNKENGTESVIQGMQLERSLQTLRTEGLTSLQQLHKSGNLLTGSMEKIANSEKEFCATEVVELAKALATTVQVQANLLKVLKEFTK